MIFGATSAVIQTFFSAVRVRVLNWPTCIVQTDKPVEIWGKLRKTEKMSPAEIMKQVTVGRFGFQNAYSVGSTINTCPNFFEMSFDKTINFLSFNVIYFANYFILFLYVIFTQCLGMKKH